jgi:hypothetical protein
MKLINLLADYRSLNDKLTIYAEANPEWGPKSEAAVILPNMDGDTHPIEVAGVQLQYMLEVRIAKEVIKVWSQWRGGRKPTPEEACEAVIFYAQNDAYLPEEDDQ